MANLVKSYINHFGLDLKSSDIVREPQYASDMLNAEYKKNGNISKREGYRGQAGSVGGAGLHSYNRVDPTTAKESQILVAVDENLHKVNETTVLIQYTGAETFVSFNVYLDKIAGVYKTTIQEDVTVVLDYNMGVGIDELTPETLADLKSNIEGISGDYTVTITGDTTATAAFIDLARDKNLAIDDVTLICRSFEQIPSPITLLPGNTTNIGDEDFHNTTSTQINNILYLSNGYDELIKYDGQNAYRAGLPKSDAPTTALGVAGALTSATGYRHSVLYAQFDAAGNLHESAMSADSADLTPTNQTIDVTVDNILAASGFNTNCAIVAGVQSGVNTITVDDGSGGSHTMIVGDTAYFFDGVSGGYVEREITSITAGSITVAGAAVDVADNAVISNNLRIGIYRNLDGGTTKFLVEEIPNNSFTATQVYNDNKIDSALGIEYLVTAIEYSLPPKGRFLSAYNNIAVLAGDLENPTTVYWADVGFPERWAPALLSLRVQSPNGDKITGLSQSNEVMAIFEKRAMHVISGDIPNNNIRVDTITKDVGCVSHDTIQEVRGSLYFLSDRGVWKTTSGQLPFEVSARVEPVFDIDPLLTESEKYVFKRAIGINDRGKEQYLLFLPAESSNLIGLTANDSSILLVEDYYRSAWLKWDNMNLAGGAVYHNGKLWFSERRNVGGTTTGTYLYSKNNRGDNWDYQDNLDPVDWEYATAWYFFNEPSVYKKFLRLKTFASEETANNAFTINTDIEKNFISGLVSNSFVTDFTGNGGGYGISAYGVAPYGDIFFPSRKCKIGPLKGTSIRFVMRNSESCQNVDIQGWELEFATPYRTELKE